MYFNLHGCNFYCIIKSSNQMFKYQGTIFSEHEVFQVYDFLDDFEIVFIFYTFNIFQKM